MDSALLFVTTAIGVLAFAVALFVVVLAGRRLGQRWQAARGRRAHAHYAALVTRIAAGRVAAVDGFPLPRLGSVDWVALEEMLRTARGAAGPESAGRIERFLDEAGFSDYYLDRLARGDRFERATAAVRLAEHRNPRATPALILAVNDPDREVRTAAVRALGYVARPEAVEALAAVLARAAEGGDEVSPRVVAGTLARAGPEAADALVPLLEHAAWRVRGAAAVLLGELRATRWVEPLIARLADAEPDVRAKAAQALGRMGAHSALFPLLGRLEDPAWLVRMHAVRALGLVGEAVAADPVGRRLVDTHWRVRQEAGAALARMGHTAHQVLTHTLLAGSDAFAREQVVEELQRTAVLSEALDALGGEMAESGEPQGPAARLLDAVASTGAYSLLLSGLRAHPDPRVRLALVRLLARHEEARVQDALEGAADTDADPLVRYEAARWLAERAAVSGAE